MSGSSRRLGAVLVALALGWGAATAHAGQTCEAGQPSVASLQRGMALAHTTAHVQKEAASLYTRELVELIFVQPYSRIGNVVEAGLAQRQTASEYLKDLCAIGVLREVKAGREKLFLHPKLLTLLASDEHTFESYGS